ncbi:MAG: hypothetical protein LBN24_10785, partial [Mediterranea sp.]|nr:hypothetical protein [Mediterranea sp.]
MKLINVLLMMSALATAASCSSGQERTGSGDNQTSPIGRSTLRIEGKRMTPEALWAMGRIGEVAVS